MNRRVLFFGLAAVVVVAIITLGLADDFFVDWLWFSSLGFASVFRTMVAARIGIFILVLVPAFAILFFSALLALRMSGEREHLRIVRRLDDVTEINLPELIRS